MEKRYEVKKNYLKPGVYSKPEEEKCCSENIDLMMTTFLNNEKEQRRIRNKNTQDKKVEEKKIAVERKILDIQIKELSAEQRLIKSRYLNMLKRSSAAGKALP